jgi:hypothetical protein
MKNQDCIRTAQSCNSDPRSAVREFHAAVVQPEMALVVFFCSSTYALDDLAAEINLLFPGTPIIGCTTAGEIGPGDCRSHSLSGASFSTSDAAAVVGHLDGLQSFDKLGGLQFIEGLVKRFGIVAPDATPENSFAFLMVDGLSGREEGVVHTFQSALGKTALFGGSAGDDQQFKSTHVFCDGAFRRDSAVVALVSTPHPFKLFKTQHFIAGSERMVVTDADEAQRLVREINGRVAAEEYARAIGAHPSELGVGHFSAFPMVVRINGMDFVCSILRANPDGSLVFYCAIERGMVMRIAQGVGLIENLKQTFAGIRDEIGEPQLVIACDCILRRLEISQKMLWPTVNELFQKNHAVGFGTYGEQFAGVHVNQTLTGIAIGRRDDDAS